jgi:hypothetical protein
MNTRSWCALRSLRGLLGGLLIGVTLLVARGPAAFASPDRGVRPPLWWVELEPPGPPLPTGVPPTEPLLAPVLAAEARERELRTAAVLSQTTMPDPRIQQMIAQITSSEIYSLTGALGGEWSAVIGGAPYTITTRHTDSGTPVQMATEYVYEGFQAAGLSTSYHNWSSGDHTGRNVVGAIAGETNPDNILLLTAHLDNMPTGSIAPGADKNASGVAALLVASQILSRYRWDCTLRFVTFTGEEQGLLGSRAYAGAAYNNGDNILGVLNLDTIAYDFHDFPIMELHVRTGHVGDLAIANLFTNVVQSYGIDLIPEIVQPGIRVSSHASFWDKGYPAILAIEDLQDFTPYYHTVYDRLSTLNMSYYTSFVQAAVATFAHMGCLTDDLGSLDGIVSDVDSGLPITATVAATGLGTSFTTSPDSGGYYTLTVPAGSYTLTAQPQLYGYYSATVEGVEVIRNITTHLDLPLQPYASYVITGTVVEANFGAALAASITTVSCPEGACHSHTYASAVTDPQSGLYSLEVISGSYTLHVQSPGYRPVTRTLQAGAPQRLDFTLVPQGCLILVDDDDGDNVETVYQADLDGLGIEYRTWTVAEEGALPLSLVEQYRQVLWFTGRHSQNTLTPGDQAVLSAYLDGGGRLLLSSWGAGSELKDTPFYATYLRAGHEGDVAPGPLELLGAGFMAGYPLPVMTNVTQQVSQLTPLIGAETIYSLPAPYNRAAGVTYAGAHKVAYLGFGLETAADAGERQAALGALLEWLEPCAPPAVGFAHSGPVELGQAVVFTNTTQPGQPTEMRYLWDFGDGVGTSTETHPVYTFTQVGAYTVTLTATNAVGSGVFTGTVIVEPVLHTAYEVYLPLVLYSTAGNDRVLR